MDQLSGEGSSLTLTITLGGALIAAIVAAIVWVILHGRARNETRRQLHDDEPTRKMD